MDELNLIGLLAGFVGTVLLSAGLVKSEEQALDESKPYWGSNPFLEKAALASRKLALAGLSSIVASFAISASIGANRLLHLTYPLPLAAILSLALTLMGWLALILFLQISAGRHIRHRQAHYRVVLHEAILGQIRQINQFNKDQWKAMDVESFKRDCVRKLRSFECMLRYYDVQVMLELCGQIEMSKDMEGILIALSDQKSQRGLSNITGC